MSLIYVAAENESAEASVELLYHNITTDSPSLNPWQEAKGGQIRYELFIGTDAPTHDLEVAIPYEEVAAVAPAHDELIARSAQRIGGEETQETIERDGNEYDVISLPETALATRTETFDGITYTIVTIEGNRGFDNRFAFAITVNVDRLAVNVARSVWQESTWALDLTLYGPVNPRAHSFLDEETIDWDLLEVDQAYSYLFLPEDVFPKNVSPEPLESFYHGGAGKFYYTWVCGQLDPWYEQRMLVTYGNYENSVVQALVVSLLAGLVLYLL